jgi:hypothetical protein
MKLFDIIIEDVELDEVAAIPDEEYIKRFSEKFPNWSYDNALIYNERKGDRNVKKIKNVFCKIHNHFFPEKGRLQGIILKEHDNGTGCSDCTKELQSAIKLGHQNKRKSEEQWRKDLSKIKKFKDIYDFTKSKITYTEPATRNGPLVSNVYCKIHKKYFNGGSNNEGFRTSVIHNNNDVCPECIYDGKFLNKTKEDWIKELRTNSKNKKYDYSKIKFNNNGSSSVIYNIICNVKDSNGKTHGMFGENGIHARNHKNGLARCPKCVCESKTKNFIKNAKTIHNNKYIYDKVDFCDDSTIIKKETLDGKKYSERKVLIGCKNHEKPLYFFQTTTTHLKGSGCPICRESKGENYIHGLLKSKFDGKYKIEREKKFSETGNLEFDFFIPELKVVIEYDGEGHFWPIFGSSESSKHLSYNKIFNNDNIKNNWIRSKNKNFDGVRLIRVPYTMEFNEIDGPLLQAIKIKNTPPNTITYLGDYPRRHNRKEVQSQFKLNESKLSLIDVLKS